MIMTAKDFFKQFPDESACVLHMKKNAREERACVPKVRVEAIELAEHD
jgi:hypothetical protein